MVPLFVLNWIGVSYHLYSIIWWWDVMTHFLGGIFIGFFVLYLGARIQLVNHHAWWHIWGAAACAAFIGWEVYEIVIHNLIPVYRWDTIDMFHDIINDSLGALVAFNWYVLFYRQPVSK